MRPTLVHAAASATLCAIGVAVVCASCTPAGDPATTAGTPAEPASAAPTHEDWLTYTDPSRGVAFRYPRDLRTGYVHPVDWPPMLQVAEGPFACTEAGSETARAGKTERTQLGTRSYCVTRESEGAAGSIYTSYAYAFEKDGRVAILTFSLRAVQCGNYDEPRKSECDGERAAFDPGAVIDEIARSAEIGRGAP